VHKVQIKIIIFRAVPGG